ncbi:MAG TPA: 50S ribosomal protein L18 [Leptospiraceae bacterium]|nr:50S ribosomal protein L18 [Leptospiraceae bacterium]HMW08143.1 50S ribosomal protein L18 [Leptospiraceae bacterium]HMX32957.1 50S ribosomal protein L18 [Leptospiraceae bacterium]HMY33946.1 50S ribosomal protein L18 [Leptospiraceae bacterium]HMZ65695.1 50S ribosomal protein L18 [Leptospiraceae bacterium]
MINKQKHRPGQERRIERARFKLKTNGDRPRLVFNKTNRYLIAQVIDDKVGSTIAYAVTSEKTFPIKGYSKKNKQSATELGRMIAERAKSKGVTKVMLDRSGIIYHGNLAAFAESARKEGLEF